MKPITIIGGGLAGLSTGIALRMKSIPVRIHESGHYPRHRVCGEFICGPDPTLFQTLGIHTLLADARRGSTSTWIHRDTTVARFHLPSPSWQVSRYTLDQRLANYFTDLGGELITGSRQPKDVISEGTILATGRQAAGESRHIGLKIHAANYPSVADLEVHFGPGAYVGVSSIENGQVNICGLFRDPPATAGLKPVERLLALAEAAQLTRLVKNMRLAQLNPASFCGVSNIQFGRQHTTPNGPVAIGDAGSLIPPFTGNGMSMAFQSAAIAAETLSHYATANLNWDDACKRIRGASSRAFTVRLKTAAIVHPLLLSASGQSLLSLAARTHLLPFKTLFSLTR